MTPGHSIFKISNIFLLLLPAFLMLLFTWLSYPYYQYYIDPDAVSYLTLTDRYLAQDYNQAINAFWSPMGVWLTVLMVKCTDWQHFAAALFVNTVAAFGVVLLAQYLFHKFIKENWERLCFGLMSAFFWTTTIYRQSFTDLWQVFFLLLALLILLRKDFLSKAYWWVILGLVAALSFFSKAFSFYFMPLMTLIVVLMKMKQNGAVKLPRLLSITAIVVSVMLLCAFPWLYILHDKYGFWTTSTAGKMNLNWWVLGHPNFKPDTKVLVPPAPYAHSLFYFEDPYLAEQKPIAFWSSGQYFLKQIVRVVYNVLDWVRCSNLVSSFYFVTWLLMLVSIFFSGLKNLLKNQLKILAAIAIVFPLPFTLMTFDNGRYLWFTIPLISIVGISIFGQLLKENWSRIGWRIFVAIFYFSFLPMSFFEMKEMFNKGKEDYEIAQQLKELHIKGSFVTNDISSSPLGHSALRIAYFTQNPYYSFGENKWTTQEILEDAKRYHVKYFFYRYIGSIDDYQLKLSNGTTANELTNGKIPGLKIFEL